MPDPGALAEALQRGGPDASHALAALVADAHPNPAHFDAYTSTLLEFLESEPEPALANLAVAALSSLIERTELSGPDPLLKVAPLALPPLIHALAVTPRIAQLSPALETLWLANRSETEQALRQWGLVSREPALRLAALAQLQAWVSGLNGRFAFRKFTPLVVSLLRDGSEPVRDAAYRLIVKFFASASPRAREDLAEIMRKQQISDATRSKVMGAISRELGRDLQSPSRPASRPVSRASPRSASASPMLSRTPTPPKLALGPQEDTGPLEIDLGVVREGAYAMQALDAVNVFSEDEFLSEVSGRLACFDGKETEGNWSQRQEAVQRFRQMLRCKYITISPATLRTAMKMMTRPLTDTLLSLRTTLVGFSCQAVKDVAQLSPANMVAELLDPVLEPLSQVAAGIKKITASAAHICMCAILIESPALSVRQFQTIKVISQSKKPHARTYALYWLRAALITSQQPVSRMEDRAADLEQIAVKGITDAVDTAREGGRQLYWALHELWPALAQRVSARLPSSAMKALQTSKPKAKSSSAAPVATPVAEPPGTPRSAEPPRGLGIVTNNARDANQPISSEAQSTPKVSRLRNTSDSEYVQKPASRETSLGISDSIADLSIRESGPRLADTLDLEDSSAVRAAVKEEGALSVLRKLATSGVSALTSSVVIRVIREQAPEVSSAADIAKLIQTDLSGASLAQRRGYLQLLERLNYEQDTIESVRPATSPAPSSIRRMPPRMSRISVYADSTSSGPDASPQSARSSASAAASPSSSSSVTSVSGDMDMSINLAYKGLALPHEVTETFSAASISPFPSTEPACKPYIEGLVTQVEQQTAKPETLAALAVLVTASGVPHSRLSPLYAAVDVWHRSYTFDMHLRDVILRYLSTRTDVPSVLLALVLLRALVVTPTQAPASAYLEPLACVQCLLQVLQTHGGKSLEIDEHALPAARDAVMQAGRSFGSRSLLELLAAAYDAADKPAARAFIVQTLEQAVAHTGLLVDEGAGVLPLVMRALDDADARVRKEAYPVLVAIHKQNELLGAHAQTRMHAGQRRLLQHYLEIS